LKRKNGNLDEASIFYKKACDGGEMLGCVSAGVVADQQGNSAEAYKLFNIACDGNNTSGCFFLGDKEHNRGNLDKALQFHIKACNIDENHMGCLGSDIVKFEIENEDLLNMDTTHLKKIPL
jgi:uncharacterized protein